MGLDQAVTGTRLVAGIGFRHGVPPDAIVALIRRAIAQAACEGALVAIATAADRADEPAIRDAAGAFGLTPVAVDAEALRTVDPRVPTRSARIERSRGVGSLAEAAALAVAGETGRLILARIDDGRATCALAALGLASDEAMREADEASALFRPPSAGVGKEAGAVSRSKTPISQRARAAQIVTA